MTTIMEKYAQKKNWKKTPKMSKMLTGKIFKVMVSFFLSTVMYFSSIISFTFVIGREKKKKNHLFLWNMLSFFSPYCIFNSGDHIVLVIISNYCESMLLPWKIKPLYNLQKISLLSTSKKMLPCCVFLLSHFSSHLIIRDINPDHLQIFRLNLFSGKQMLGKIAIIGL